MPGTIIAAVGADGAIGIDGRLPWRYPGDLKRFREQTLGCTVVMGRKTWESFGQRPLPQRTNVVVSGRPPLGAPWWYRRLCSVRHFGPIFYIGGAQLYREALTIADKIDLTLVPDLTPNATVHFPAIDPDHWIQGPMLLHEYEPKLRRIEFTRRIDRF